MYMNQTIYLYHKCMDKIHCKGFICFIYETNIIALGLLQLPLEVGGGIIEFFPCMMYVYTY